MRKKSFKNFVVLVVIGQIILSCTNQQQPTKDEKTPPQKTPELNFTPKVIYGDDNRYDLFALTDLSFVEKAQSTVALIRGFKVKPQTDGTHLIDSLKFGESYNLCSDERFADQPVAAFCSGFLIAPNLIATAGHCMQNQSVCKDTAIVFGYGLKTSQDNAKTVNSEDVYRCQKIIHTQIAENGSDFAIVELDRSVINHPPLPIRIAGSIQTSDVVTVIGHPTGLPTKVTTSGYVRSIKPTFFITNLDTYGGNSGSAVLNEATGEVEGILVRGAQDYKFENGCLRSVKCKEDECRGEDVTLISELLKYIP